MWVTSRRCIGRYVLVGGRVVPGGKAGRLGGGIGGGGGGGGVARTRAWRGRAEEDTQGRTRQLARVLDVCVFVCVL